MGQPWEQCGQISLAFPEMVKKSWERLPDAFALEGLKIPTLPLWELRAARAVRRGEKAEGESKRELDEKGSTGRSVW